MDPNDTLRRLRYLVRYTNMRKFELREELGEAFEALDNWLCTGGFLPDDWKPRCGDTRKDDAP